MPRFAANLTMMFTGLPFMDRFAAAAHNGFKAAEFLFPYDVDPDDITEKLQRHGLTQALFDLPPGNRAVGERDLAALPGCESEYRTSVIAALRFAGIIVVDRLHVMRGNASFADTEAVRIYRDSLAYLCDMVGGAGLTIVIEPINPRDMLGYFLNDFNFAADLIADLALPNVKLQFDIYHWQVIYGDVMTGMGQLMPIIGHIQFAAVPLRHEPGTGELDDTRILHAIDDLGCTGFVGCEYRPTGDTVAEPAWRAAFS